MEDYTNNNRDLKAVVVGGVLILLVGSYFIWSSFSSGTGKNSAVSDKEATDVPTITPTVLRQKLNNHESIQLIDIRPAEAFQAEHLIASLSVPIGSLDSVTPVQDESLVIIYSPEDPQDFDTAKNILRQAPFPYFFLQGGFEAWKASHYQTLSAGDPNSFIDQSKVTYVSAADLKKLLANTGTPPFLLDVQSPEDFNANHIRGAVNIPIDQLEHRLNEIPPARRIVVYGENELISFQAGVRLSDLNIFSVETLTGNATLTKGSGLLLDKP